ncbi:hypothetical protein PILCRDRAFT_15239 [Piloderma croceum F 1598]|uniref:receptor protein-tyrosine kinase n=1 Tax=Piloderma croceum (strain F 1598) TaxID=765440 RepID=A0A0C3AI01_PILCF|nr:hypothetical protein PILCRDRAFT_15239 [Piloderma croceum F 1598]
MTNGSRKIVAAMNWTFNISVDNATECSNNGTFTFPLPSSPASSGTANATVSANHSSSSGSHVGAIAGGVVGGLVACLLAVTGIMMYNRHRHDVRRRMTLQFMMKKGLGSGKMVDSKDVELAGRS